jgi:hypothetical protein
VNLVALTGRLKADSQGPTPARPGWGTVAIEVRRREPADAGAIVVTLVLPPHLARLASEELRAGDHVAVVGMLDIDVACGDHTPTARPSVVAESIEPLP